MALRHLDSAVMLQISATWLDSTSEAHNALVALADLATFLPRLNKPHTTLAALLQPGHNARVSTIIQEQFDIDIRHDNLIRGIVSLLSASAELLADDAARNLLELRAFLAPEGLSSTQKSYRAEATQAAQLKDRITPEIKAQLDSLNIGMSGQSKPLSHFVDEWLTLGKNLGMLEDEKARLQDSPADTTGQAIMKARNLWIRTVNALIAQAELVEIDEATDRLVFGPLRAASKNAERKARGRAGSEAQGVDGNPQSPTSSQGDTTTAPLTTDQDT